jgi:sec-independent protein translocase protein TatA
MDFLDIGGGEILLIIIVALLLWGPGKIVEISRSLGKTARSFKSVSSDLTAQISKELEEQKKEEASKARIDPKP